MIFCSEINWPLCDGLAYGQRHRRELTTDADTSTDEVSAILAALGAAIREHRTAAGLTQAQLAERAGIGRPHLNHIESGRKSPTVVVLVHLARGMGVDPADLLQTQAVQKGATPRQRAASIR